jgi:hypothetical protein
MPPNAEADVDAEPDVAMVSLPGGFRVPEQFPIRLAGRARRVPVQAHVAVEMHGDRPHVRALAIWASGSGPLAAADLAALDLPGLLDAAVQQAALQHTPMRWQPDQTDTPAQLGVFLGWASEQWAADERAALASARTARDRRRVTPADLRRVLDVHAAKGIEGVRAELGYSERNARRLLARARKELP